MHNRILCRVPPDGDLRILSWNREICTSWQVINFDTNTTESPVLHTEEDVIEWFIENRNVSRETITSVLDGNDERFFAFLNELQRTLMQ